MKAARAVLSRSLVAVASLVALSGRAGALSDDQYEQLVSALKNADAFKVRLQAAVVLGRAGGAKAVEPLVGALDDPEVAVRAASAMALGNLADLRAVTPLVRVTPRRTSRPSS